jgi:hypothetical protein
VHLNLRFPGGESYKDMIRRLESVVVDLEQQVIPALVVSHVSTLQVLIAYFRRSPVEKCMHIEVPLHTIIKFTPARGGGWSESQHPLSQVSHSAGSDVGKLVFEGLEQLGQSTGSSVSAPSTPIWGDHMQRASTTSLGSVNRNDPLLVPRLAGPQGV